MISKLNIDLVNIIQAHEIRTVKRDGEQKYRVVGVNQDDERSALARGMTHAQNVSEDFFPDEADEEDPIKRNAASVGYS